LPGGGAGDILPKDTLYFFAQLAPLFHELEKANRWHLSVRRIAGAQMKHFSGALWAASQRVLTTCETPTRLKPAD